MKVFRMKERHKVSTEQRHTSRNIKCWQREGKKRLSKVYTTVYVQACAYVQQNAWKRAWVDYPRTNTRTCSAASRLILWVCSQLRHQSTWAHDLWRLCGAVTSSEYSQTQTNMIYGMFNTYTEKYGVRATLPINLITDISIELDELSCWLSCFPLCFYSIWWYTHVQKYEFR